MSLLKVDAITGKSDTTEVNSPITFTANTATLNSGVDLGLTANHSGVKTAMNASGDMPIYACRAWVNFQGTGTVAIRSSGNVSSIADLATGRYEVNFTTFMSDTNYSALTDGNVNSSNVDTRRITRVTHYYTSGFKMVTGYVASDSPEDFEFVGVAVIR